MKSLSQQFLDTLELRKGSIITHAEVRALTRRWRPFGSHCEYRMGEAERVNDCGPYQVDVEATDAGLAWWMGKVFTSRGEVRATKFMTEECGRDFYTLQRILRRFDRFALEGWTEVDNGHRFSWFCPLYTMYGGGEHLRFVRRSWQSGGTYLF